jgi:hypothetical protein
MQNSFKNRCVDISRKKQKVNRRIHYEIFYERVDTVMAHRSDATCSDERNRRIKVLKQLLIEVRDYTKTCGSCGTLAPSVGGAEVFEGKHCGLWSGHAASNILVLSLYILFPPLPRPTTRAPYRAGAFPDRR